ncbi:MAG: LuxR C-terminal-related transcriptional regulator [Acidobacteriota bacterium]
MPSYRAINRLSTILTERERQVLKLLVDGYSNEEAGQLLMLSRRTIEAHRARIMMKLNLHDLPALVKYSIRIGLTSVNEHRSDSQFR